MRESRRTEKMQLPKDATEAWLETQKPSLRGARHRNSPKDTLEAWVEEQACRVPKPTKPAA